MTHFDSVDAVYTTSTESDFHDDVSVMSSSELTEQTENPTDAQAGEHDKAHLP